MALDGQVVSARLGGRRAVFDRCVLGCGVGGWRSASAALAVVRPGSQLQRAYDAPSVGSPRFAKFANSRREKNAKPG